MDDLSFIINDRFTVNPAFNQIKDGAGEIARMEPRHMAVLCFLVQRTGQLVTREQLIAAIWNNYGGGDEGLSQAISYLRKLLRDKEKKIIQTIPKKGYLLCAMVTEPLIEHPLPAHKPLNLKNGLKRFSKFAALLYVVVTAGYFIYSYVPKSKPKKEPVTYPVADFQQNDIAYNVAPIPNVRPLPLIVTKPMVTVRVVKTVLKKTVVAYRPRY